jgi:hypothetical protein
VISARAAQPDGRPANQAHRHTGLCQSAGYPPGLIPDILERFLWFIHKIDTYLNNFNISVRRGNNGFSAS